MKPRKGAWKKYTRQNAVITSGMQKEGAHNKEVRDLTVTAVDASPQLRCGTPWHAAPPWPRCISATPGPDLQRRAQFQRVHRVAITRRHGGRGRPPTLRVHLRGPERDTLLPTHYRPFTFNAHNRVYEQGEQGTT
eukprot:Gb_12809 [translate_table: standard]